MKTTSIILQTLCVPCNCHCRYCLLSYNGKTVGADYTRSKEYAKRFYSYLKENRPNIQYNFTFGYCMDHPTLYEELDFLQSIDSVQGKMLQFDGMGFRNNEEIKQLMNNLKIHGMEHLNFTFYGLRDYHDRFAGRKGDFDYMISLLKAAKEQGIETSVGIPITSENCNTIEDLLVYLTEAGSGRLSIFIPHSEGRGKTLDSIRLSLDEYNKMSENSKTLLNRNVFKTESEWVKDNSILTDENRALIISLTPDNIEQFENMSVEEVINLVEELDEKYYSVIPSFEELKKMYGNNQSKLFYRKRDLYWKYQKQYINEHGIRIYDVTDERQCGSRRY